MQISGFQHVFKQIPYFLLYALTFSPCENKKSETLLHWILSLNFPHFHTSVLLHSHTSTLSQFTFLDFVLWNQKTKLLALVVSCSTTFRFPTSKIENITFLILELLYFFLSSLPSLFLNYQYISRWIAIDDLLCGGSWPRSIFWCRSRLNSADLRLFDAEIKYDCGSVWWFTSHGFFWVFCLYGSYARNYVSINDNKITLWFVSIWMQNLQQSPPLELMEIFNFWMYVVLVIINLFIICNKQLLPLWHQFQWRLYSTTPPIKVNMLFIK